MLRLLHTADWHLGRRFPSFPDEGQKKLSRARMDVISRILDVARRNAVNAVLCVGDIFDDADPAPDFWEGLARTFRNHAGQHPPLVPHAARVWRTLDAKSQQMVLETDASVAEELR